jgi:kanamycin kinase
MPFAHIPPPTTAPPAKVRELAGGASLTPVWRNQRGGLAFRAGATPTNPARYVKWGPRNAETSMAAEAERLRWAAAHTPVPAVVEQGEDAAREWLVTIALPGESAVAPRWTADPERAVRAVGRGLRELHERLPVAECPFEWGVPGRIANAARRGIHVASALRDAPPADRVVVCHGDACAPNTLIGDDGGWIGHVDVGSLGVADRWADIAVAAMSCGWNYGPGWEPALLDAYGVEPDSARMEYYAALWNAT